MQTMGSHAVFKEKLLPIAEDPSQHVTTVLICTNGLMRSGIGLILEGSGFALSDRAVEDLTECPDDLPSLFIICDRREVDGYDELIATLRQRCPSARIVLMADNLDTLSVLHLIRSGLSGYCPTSMGRKALVKALDLVMEGEVFIPTTVTMDLVNNPDLGMRRTVTSKNLILGPGTVKGTRLERLSERELQILRCLTKGASNKMIAKELGLAEATIKVHLKGILRKAKVANRTQAAMWASEVLGPAMEDAIMVA